MESDDIEMRDAYQDSDMLNGHSGYATPRDMEQGDSDEAMAEADMDDPNVLDLPLPPRRAPHDHVMREANDDIVILNTSPRPRGNTRPRARRVRFTEHAQESTASDDVLKSAKPLQIPDDETEVQEMSKHVRQAMRAPGILTRLRSLEYDPHAIVSHSGAPEACEKIGGPAFSTLESPHSFTVSPRDPTIECKCPPSKARPRKELAFVGVRGRQLTWMHLPCKPYLDNVSDTTIANIKQKMQLVKSQSEGLSTTVQMQNVILGMLGPNATEQQKKKVSNLTSNYLCDGPCKGSKDSKDYFCCKKCWTWQHKPCMLYGDQGDRGGPVCNHCYVQFASIQKAMVEWQKLRLLLALREAWKFIQDPANATDIRRLRFCKKFVGDFLKHNLGHFNRFVVARRRVQYLVRHRHLLFRRAAPPAQSASTSTAPTASQANRKAADKKPATRDALMSKPGPAEKPTVPAQPESQMDVDPPVGVDYDSAMEVDEETIIVRPKNPGPRPAATRASTVRPRPRPTPASRAGVPAAPKAKAKGQGKIKRGRSTLPSLTPSECTDSDAMDTDEGPMKKVRQFSQSQKSTAPRKSVRPLRQAERPASYLEPQLDSEWEEEEEEGMEDGDFKRGARAQTDSSYDDNQGSRPAPRRRRANRTVPQDENDEHPDEESRSGAIQIACVCVDVMPKRSNSFKCGQCGKYSHLACNRDGILPNCAFCARRPLRPHSQPRPPPPSRPLPPFLPPSAGLMPLSRVPAPTSQPKRQPSRPLPPFLPPSAGLVPLSGVPAPTSQPKREPRPKSTPAPPPSGPRPLSDEMKEEVRHICSAYLWKTWVDMPLPGADQTQQTYTANDRPPAYWLAEIEARLIAMMEAAGEAATHTYMHPAMSQMPRKKGSVVKALRELALSVIYQGAYRQSGRQRLGVLGEVLGLADKGTYWKGRK